MGPHRVTIGKASGSRFADVLRIRPFAVLYTAETVSIAGDQLARIALAVLVFDRTGSTVATALTYAISFLPAILGGFILARIGDRYPRRPVMVGCDLVRGALFVVMAIPGTPLIVVVALLALAVFIGPAFSAAEVSYLAAVLEPETFRAGTGLRMITNQVAQVVGFAVGGAAVATLGSHGALALDAATYAASALAIAIGVRRVVVPTSADARSASRSFATPPPALARRPSPGPLRLWRIRRVRALLGLSAVAGLFVVPEGLAVPFGSQTGATTVEIGFLLASIPLGGALGVALVVRRVPRTRRTAVAGWMAVGCGLPLMAATAFPHWPIALGCWFVSGLLASYQVEIFTAIVHAVPDRQRSRLVGVGSSVLVGAQGLGLVVFGWITSFVSPSAAIGLAGLAGSSLALVLVLGPLASPRGRPRPATHRSYRLHGGSGAFRVTRSRSITSSTPRGHQELHRVIGISSLPTGISQSESDLRRVLPLSADRSTTDSRDATVE